MIDPRRPVVNGGHSMMREWKPKASVWLHDDAEFPTLVLTTIGETFVWHRQWANYKARMAAMRRHVPIAIADAEQFTLL